MTKNLSARLKPPQHAPMATSPPSSYDKESQCEIKTCEHSPLPPPHAAVHMTKNLSARLKPNNGCVIGATPIVHMTKNLSARLKREYINLNTYNVASSYDKESQCEIKTFTGA